MNAFKTWFLIGGLLTLMDAGPVSALGTSFEPGVTLVSTSELKELLEKTRNVTLINTLSAIEFDNQTIPGSINIPYEHIKEHKTPLPKDKSAHLVFFCKGFK
jgi:hypothetical protein